MTGAIAMGTNKITGLGNPTLAQDASTKTYTDSKLALTGGTMTGAVAMGGFKVTGLGAPTAASADAATATYAETVASTAAATRLALSGGTMTGNITSLRTNDTSIVLGSSAGSGTNTVAIGNGAGLGSQGANGVAIGPNAGQAQGVGSVALGSLAGNSGQAVTCVAVGAKAGETNQGERAVAIGANAGSLNQHIESIAINASALTLETTASNQIKIQAGTTLLVADETGFQVPNTTNSTSSSTGAINTAGGLGVGQNLHVGGSLHLANVFRIGPQWNQSVQGTEFAAFNTDTVINSATGIGTLTIPANTMTVGSLFLFRCGGTIRTTATPTFTPKIKLNGITMISPIVNPPTALTNRPWRMEVYLNTLATGGAGVASAMSSALFQCVGATAVTSLMFPLVVSPVQPVNTGWSTTIANPVTLTGLWSVSNANNAVTVTHFSITRLC
jgi:hypothetical protein